MTQKGDCASNTDSSVKEKQEESTLSKRLKDLDINKAKLEFTDDVKEEGADFKKNDGCSNCRRPNPRKKCSKRHTKCSKKLFCDKVCETAAHQKKSMPEESTTSVPDDSEHSQKLSSEEMEKKTKAAKEADAKMKKAYEKAKRRDCVMRAVGPSLRNTGRKWRSPLETAP